MTFHLAEAYFEEWIRAQYNLDRSTQLLEEARRLTRALEHISKCNDGKGYMPEYAERAIYTR